MTSRPFVVGFSLGIVACGGWYAYAMHCRMPLFEEPLHGLSGDDLEDAIERNYARQRRWLNTHPVCSSLPKNRQTYPADVLRVAIRQAEQAEHDKQQHDEAQRMLASGRR